MGKLGTSTVQFFSVQVDKQLLHGRHKVHKKGSAASHKREVTDALQELLSEEYSSVLESALLSNPWRAVEAYHFFLLAHRLFYSGNFQESLRIVSQCC